MSKPNLGTERDLENRPTLRKPLDRRASDRSNTGQLLWSFTVAICLILAAMIQWSSPRNVLLEQDRAPAQIRYEPAPTLPSGS